jgi:dienelactone hydrolase|tara:strand:+ start:11872 stop:14151 length:2280 start_codon:yes stop_codon:yes gene_type:complete
MRRFSLILAVLLAAIPTIIIAQPLPNTEALKLEGDIASHLVDGVDRFLLKQLEHSITARSRYWNRDTSSAAAYTKSVAPNRTRLAEITGVVDTRIAFDDLEVIGGTTDGPVQGRSAAFEAIKIRWPVIRNIHGVGLLLNPTKPNGKYVIAVPDADHTPEMISGLAPGLDVSQQYARHLAENGFTVLVPTLISREYAARNGRAKMTSREFLYRSSFILGRHLIGYEVQKILALVDWCSSRNNDDASIGVIGWGEGGLLSLYSAALDERIDAACVSGYFNSRQTMWSEPISRNVYALLDQFGDAELATLIAPRKLVIEAAAGPELELAGGGGAPAKLASPALPMVQAEMARAVELIDTPNLSPFNLIITKDGQGDFGSQSSLRQFVKDLGQTADWSAESVELRMSDNQVDAKKREAAQMSEIDQHNQWLLSESHFVRKDFMKNLDTSSVAAYEKSAEWYRDYFREETIGHFELDLLPPNTRSRLIEKNDKWSRYEVVLDVFEDVIAYGLLTLPTGIKADEKRPVVVCQHGLEGRPDDVIGEKGYHAYSGFATALAERGFITFAPQNLYIFTDRFRTLQRKSYPLRKTLFSTIVPQHQQIVNWLKTLDQVDSKRIAFYGLSYGGKSAMRIPPLVTDYCLSICSADFNEWVFKNATTRYNFSYMWTGEYEIFEWNLGGTFNYAEMAYLIAPRPFMVERGHYDGVGEDHWVGYEFARVRHMYQAKLKLKDTAEIEWFDGPHTINGVGTYRFLHKHLDWPEPQAK